MAAQARMLNNEANLFSFNQFQAETSKRDFSPEPVTPWGIFLSSFETEALVLPDSIGDLDDKRDHLARYCGYSNYLHVVSLLETFSEFWEPHFWQHVQRGERTIEVASNGLLMQVEGELKSILRKKDPETTLNGREISTHRPFQEDMSFSATLQGVRDIGSELVYVKAGDTGSGTMSYQALSVLSLVNPNWLKKCFDLFSRMDDILDDYGRFQCTKRYALEACRTDFDSFVEEDRRLFYREFISKEAHLSYSVYPQKEHQWLTILMYDEREKTAKIWGVLKSQWEGVLSQIAVIDELGVNDGASLEVIQTLSKASCTSWDCHSGFEFAFN